MNFYKHGLILLLFFTASIFRLSHIDFPYFNSDEARIAARGYTLSTKGHDELGRVFPIIFNSLEDYQLPITSYLTAAGELIFGKNDLGARFFFILIGGGVVLLTYKLSLLLTRQRNIALLSGFFAAFSPGLIFFSKIPNDYIVLTLLILILIILLRKENINIIAIAITFLLAFLVSKIAWLIILPIVILTLLLKERKFTKKNILFVLIGAITVLVAFISLASIPQGKRSLMENNFQTFNDLTIRNEIADIKGEGLKVGWPPLIEKILFNKLQLLVAVFFHWASYFQLRILFANLDKSGGFGFFNQGFFPKLALIPFTIGIFLIIFSETKRRISILLYYILVSSYFILFTFPTFKIEFIVVTLPFISIIMAFGMNKISTRFRNILLLLIVCEVLLTTLFVTSSTKNSNYQRPAWVKDIVKDSYQKSLTKPLFISDDIVEDLPSFLKWYSNVEMDNNYLDIRYPYKLRQTKVQNISLIGFDNQFTQCGRYENLNLIVSDRDLKRMGKAFKPQSSKIYKDTLGNDKAFNVNTRICLE